jgi:hypothetical protein
VIVDAVKFALYCALYAFTMKMTKYHMPWFVSRQQLRNRRFIASIIKRRIMKHNNYVLHIPAYAIQ